MKTKIFAAALFSAVAAPAVAADLYGGVNVGQNKYDDSTMTTNTSTAFSLVGGGTINENLAVEAAYTRLGSLEPDSATPGMTLKGNAISLSGVGSVPINQQFSLFGKLGLARTTSDISYLGITLSGNKTGVAFGLGSQYNISPAISMRASFDRYKVGTTVGTANWSANADVLSVGAVFKF